MNLKNKERATGAIKKNQFSLNFIINFLLTLLILIFSCLLHCYHSHFDYHTFVHSNYRIGAFD